MINDGPLYRINLKLQELALQESKKKISEKEYIKQRDELKARAYKMIQDYIFQEREKFSPKKEPEKKTVPTKLSQWW